MTREEFLDRIDEIMCGTSNAERAYLEELYDEVTKPHWISVNDELPKNKELVFITDGEYTDTGFYEYTFDEWQPCEKWLGDITHWMPLPQPPVLSNSVNTGKKGGAQ